MPGFVGDQKSPESAQAVTSVSLVNFTPSPSPIGSQQKQKLQPRSLERHGYHGPLTRGKIFWVCEVEETETNVSEWKPQGRLAVCCWHTEGCCACLEEPLALESSDAKLRLPESKEKVNASFAFCKGIDKHYHSAWEKILHYKICKRTCTALFSDSPPFLPDCGLYYRKTLSIFTLFLFSC